MWINWALAALKMFIIQLEIIIKKVENENHQKKSEGKVL
jgi:hypothetical protein